MTGIGDLRKLDLGSFDNGLLFLRGIDETDEFAQDCCADRIGSGIAICNIYHDADQWQRQVTLFNVDNATMVVAQGYSQTSCIWVFDAVIMDM